MDLKIVVRELVEKGMTREKIIDNLKELGVSDAEKIYDDSLKEGKTTQPSQPSAPSVPASPPSTQSRQAKEKPGESEGVLGEVSLSELSKGKNLFASGEKREKSGENEEEKPSRSKTPEELVAEIKTAPSEGKKAEIKPEELVEDLSEKPKAKARSGEEEPKIVFPTIIEETQEGEKEVVGVKEEPVEEKKTGEEAVEAEAQLDKFAKAPPQSIEEKIDETIALLKALRELNKKILETDRKLLLRVK